MVEVSKVSLYAAFAVILAACAGIRDITYPDSITYIDSSELKSAMHEMASTIAQLDYLVFENPEDQIDPSRVTDLLDTLDHISARLGAEGVVTNHRAIDEHLPEFREAIARARLMASANPPNYYPVGRVSGACSACHQFR